MFRFITPPDLAIFTGLLGIVMVLTGLEIGGAICITGSCLTFAFIHWLSSPDAQEPTRKDAHQDDEPADLEALAASSDEFYERLKAEDLREWIASNGVRDD